MVLLLHVLFTSRDQHASNLTCLLDLWMGSLVFPASRDGAASKDELLSAYAGRLQVVQDMGKLLAWHEESPLYGFEGEECVADHVLQQVNYKFA